MGETRIAELSGESTTELEHEPHTRVAELSAERVAELEHGASTRIAEAEAEGVIELEHGGHTRIAEATAEAVVELQHNAHTRVSDLDAEAIVLTGGVPYGLPPVVVPAEVSFRGDRFVDDRRDYPTYAEARRKRDILIRLQSIADEIEAKRISRESTFVGLANVDYTGLSFSYEQGVQLVRSVRDTGDPEANVDQPAYYPIDQREHGELFIHRFDEVSNSVDPMQPYRIKAEGGQTLPLVRIGDDLQIRQTTHELVLRWTGADLYYVICQWLPIQGHCVLVGGPTPRPEGFPILPLPPTIEDVPLGGNLTFEGGLTRSTVEFDLNLILRVDQAGLYQPFRFEPDFSTAGGPPPLEFTRADGGTVRYTLTDFATPYTGARFDGNPSVWRVIKRATRRTTGRIQLVREQQDYHRSGAVAPAGYTPAPSGPLKKTLIRLREPMPFAGRYGDQVQLIEGCDKTYDTCRDVHRNGQNFGGQPFLPGEDKLAQQVNFKRTIVSDG